MQRQFLKNENRVWGHFACGLVTKQLYCLRCKRRFSAPAVWVHHDPFLTVSEAGECARVLMVAVLKS